VGTIVSAFLGTGTWLYDQYVKLSPIVAPKTADAAAHVPPPFIIQNVSPFFKMDDVQLICGIDSSQFLTSDGKSVGFGTPITSGRKNPPLKANGGSAEFPCDPSAFMKIENGELSLMGMQTKSFNAASGNSH